MAKKKDEITIRSSAAEYLTYVASMGDQQDSIEMRYEDENIWLTQKMIVCRFCEPVSAEKPKAFQIDKPFQSSTVSLFGKKIILMEMRHPSAFGKNSYKPCDISLTKD